MNIQDQIISTIWYTKRIINLTYFYHKIKKKFSFVLIYSRSSLHIEPLSIIIMIILCVSLFLLTSIEKVPSVTTYHHQRWLCSSFLEKKNLYSHFFFFFIVIWVFACAPKRQLLPPVIKDETMYQGGKSGSQDPLGSNRIHRDPIGSNRIQ
jgi:hypothetical protein